MSIPTTATYRVGAVDPIAFTPSGAARVSLRLVASRRVKDPQTGEWGDGPATWLGATVWRELAEAIDASGLEKGTEVLVAGELRERRFTTRDGSERSVIELDVKALAPTITPRQRVTVSRGPSRTPAEPAAPAADGFGDPFANDRGPW